MYFHTYSQTENTFFAKTMTQHFFVEYNNPFVGWAKFFG